MLKTVTESISAGILIAIGGCVFLACDNKTVGAILFSVALLCICYLGYYLFTGKIGYLIEDHSFKNIVALVSGLAGNLIVTFLLGMLIRCILPSLGGKATEMCAAKIEQTFFITFIRAVFCGILMYLAVQIFRQRNSPLGILFCVPVFILSGFEHSVADMFYFGASGLLDLKIVTFEMAAIFGNTVGSIILPILSKAGDRFAKKN